MCTYFFHVGLSVPFLECHSTTLKVTYLLLKSSSPNTSGLVIFSTTVQLLKCTIPSTHGSAHKRIILPERVYCETPSKYTYSLDENNGMRPRLKKKYEH